MIKNKKYKIIKKQLNCKINQNKFKLLLNNKYTKIIKKTEKSNLKHKNQLKIQYKRCKKN